MPNRAPCTLPSRTPSSPPNHAHTVVMVVGEVRRFLEKAMGVYVKMGDERGLAEAYRISAGIFAGGTKSPWATYYIHVSPISHAIPHVCARAGGAQTRTTRTRPRRSITCSDRWRWWTRSSAARASRPPTSCRNSGVPPHLLQFSLSQGRHRLTINSPPPPPDTCIGTGTGSRSQVRPNSTQNRQRTHSSLYCWVQGWRSRWSGTRRSWRYAARSWDPRTPSPSGPARTSTSYSTASDDYRYRRPFPLRDPFQYCLTCS